MKTFYPLTYSLLAIFMIGLGCSSKKKSQDTSSMLLPVARGEPNVILVVMDTNQWSGALGQAIRGVFSAYVPGLPQDEPYFKVRNINPAKLNSILKTAENMLFVSTLDNTGVQSRVMNQYFTPKALERIKSDTALYKLVQKDKFARGQEILHLFGKTEQQLMAHLARDKDMLRSHFINIQNKRAEAKQFKTRAKQVENLLLDEHGFFIKVPYGYELAKDEQDFVWLRRLDPAYETNLFIQYRPYTSMEPFEDVGAFRESITTKYLRDIEKPDIYMTLQAENRQVKAVNFNGKYAKEIRGLWKLSDISGGGPFVGYVFADEAKNRLYYVEGYVYAPSKDKRELMQQVEVMVHSFRTKVELQPKDK